MELHLHGQSAIGGARGIGHAITQEFARDGANVALFDREPLVADADQQLAAQHAVRVSVAIGDESNYDNVRQAAAQFQRDLGRHSRNSIVARLCSGQMISLLMEARNRSLGTRGKTRVPKQEFGNQGDNLSQGIASFQKTSSASPRLRQL